MPHDICEDTQPFRLGVFSFCAGATRKEADKGLRASGLHLGFHGCSNQSFGLLPLFAPLTIAWILLRMVGRKGWGTQPMG